MGILEGVDWQQLAEELKLTQIDDIDSYCSHNKNPLQCKLREVVKKFISAHKARPCCETAEDIASALQRLQDPNNNAAGKLRERMCTSKGI